MRVRLLRVLCVVVSCCSSVVSCGGLAFRNTQVHRGRRCPLLVLYCSRGPGFLSCHGTTELQQTPRSSFNNGHQVSTPKATSLSLLHAEAGLRKLRHLTKWAGAAVRMGQQGGQTEALWTHLDPSKPEEQRIMPLICPDARAVGCHAGTSTAVTIAL